MKNVRFSSVAFILVALLSASCSESPSNPTSPSTASGSLALTAGQLTGTWTLASLQPAGQSSQASPAPYTITFADGRVSSRVDCNSCSGAFTLSGQTLTVGPTLACTRAACRTMAFESLYTSILGGDHTAELLGGTLVLQSSRGRLVFAQ